MPNLKTGLVGTGTLLRLIARRERAMLPTWIALIVVTGAGVLPYYARLLPTDKARLSLAAEIADNALLRAFSGQLAGPSLESLGAWKVREFVFALIALMAVLTVVRHTRAEEESGRQELLLAGTVGRQAQLCAVLLVAGAASLLIGLLIAFSWIGFGADPTGSLAFGLSAAAMGWVHAGVAALAAQLCSTARAANGVAMTVLGAGLLLRFFGDGIGQHWLSWLSPEGWSHLVQPFAAERWWVLALPLAASLALAAVAARLVTRRDFGAGLLPTRPGPATWANRGVAPVCSAGNTPAPAPLCGAGGTDRLPGDPAVRAERAQFNTAPMALAWRLHRGPLLGWAAGFGVAGLVIGGMGGSLAGVGGQTSWGQEVFRRYAGGPDASYTDVFLWVMVITFGYVAALYPMLATLRLRAEETSGRADLILATPVGRLRLAASHLVFALLGTVAVLAVAGLALGLVHGLSTGDVAGQLPRMLAGALVQVPAVWVLGGFAVFAFGVLPRAAAALCWAAFLFLNMFGEVLGPVFGLDYWLADLAVPFHHLPKILSGAEFSAAPLLVLTAITAALATTGLMALRRRDFG